MRKLLTAILVTCFLIPTYADEGMWIPLLLGNTRYDQMVKLGCKLSLDDIYSINKPSLKDAVVLFGGGCTGVIVSNEGLLLTNHHCGYRSIQSHSSVEHDYLTNGFIANAKSEELPNPSLSVSFLVRMEDVTDSVLKNVSQTFTETERHAVIQFNIDRLIASYSKTNSNRFIIKPVYYENQYFLYEYEVFTDVRLVAAPPSSIGKFGGDTDNWVWPRHTGDFSVFRIYADKNNKPAPYSPDNVPYKPRRFVPISIKGISDGDFTMVYGYPGSTKEYLSSREVELMNKLQLPQDIALRTIRLTIMQDAMMADAKTRIQYAAKYNGISNSWKKWQGMVLGFEKSHAIEQKKLQEAQFSGWVNQDETRKKAYGNILNDLNKCYETYEKVMLPAEYYTESVVAVELLDQGRRLYNFINQKASKSPENFPEEFKKYVKTLDGFYKDYSPAIDRKIFEQLMLAYKKNISPEFHPEIFSYVERKFHGDFKRWADEVFEQSLLASSDKINAFAAKWTKKSMKTLMNDPSILIYASFYKVVEGKIANPYNQSLGKMDSLYRFYVRALQEFHKDKILFPDANLTLRVSFGQVNGYSPRDGVNYSSFTTTDGLFEKEDTSIADYKLSPTLADLCTRKDFGRYADKDGKMHVCFVASNHTSGGNSGSPVFNANGELIGLNFDRCWEGTMSDIYYDPSICRNITLDIRYLMFVLEKVCGARHLVDEMQIVSL